MKYQNMIGDGKLPNYYWVFHFDEKAKIVDECIEPLNDNDNAKGGLLGRFKTYKEALQCVDNDAYYPHVFIEDRLSGMIFEQVCIVCLCCGKEDYETFPSYQFTKKRLEELGKVFE